MGRLLRRAGVDVRPRGRIRTAPPPQLPAGLWELHRQGLRPADIAARTPGTTAADIARALHSAGLAPHRGRPLPSAQGLAADYARAGSVRALARQLHADEDRLRGALAAAGVPAGSLRRIPVQLRHQVAVLAATGASSAQIARHDRAAPCRHRGPRPPGGKHLRAGQCGLIPACHAPCIAHHGKIMHYRRVLSI